MRFTLGITTRYIDRHPTASMTNNPVVANQSENSQELSCEQQIIALRPYLVGLLLWLLWLISHKPNQTTILPNALIEKAIRKQASRGKHAKRCFSLWLCGCSVSALVERRRRRRVVDDELPRRRWLPPSSPRWLLLPPPSPIHKSSTTAIRQRGA
jgi:hypothetical protein